MASFRTTGRKEKGQCQDLHVSHQVGPVMTVTWPDFVFEFQEPAGPHSCSSLIINSGY